MMDLEKPAGCKCYLHKLPTNPYGSVTVDDNLLTTSRRTIETWNFSLAWNVPLHSEGTGKQCNDAGDDDGTKRHVAGTRGILPFLQPPNFIQLWRGAAVAGQGGRSRRDRTSDSPVALPDLQQHSQRVRPGIIPLDRLSDDGRFLFAWLKPTPPPQT